MNGNGADVGSSDEDRIGHIMDAAERARDLAALSEKEYASD